MDGRMDGWIDTRIDGWIYTNILLILLYHIESHCSMSVFENSLFRLSKIECSLKLEANSPSSLSLFLALSRCQAERFISMFFSIRSGCRKTRLLNNLPCHRDRQDYFIQSFTHRFISERVRAHERNGINKKGTFPLAA